MPARLGGHLVISVDQCGAIASSLDIIASGCDRASFWQPAFLALASADSAMHCLAVLFCAGVILVGLAPLAILSSCCMAPDDCAVTGGAKVRAARLKSIRCFKVLTPSDRGNDDLPFTCLFASHLRTVTCPVT